jgi:hypothetical protein
MVEALRYQPLRPTALALTIATILAMFCATIGTRHSVRSNGAAQTPTLLQKSSSGHRGARAN